MLADIIAMRMNSEPQEMFDGVLLVSRVANIVTVAPVTMTKEQIRDQYKMKLPLLCIDVIWQAEAVIFALREHFLNNVIEKTRYLSRVINHTRESARLAY